jgi:hypothetical protein
MLTIRQEQFAVLSQLEVEKFADWVFTHLQRFFPAQCRAAGDVRISEMIEYGIERAAAYNLTSKRDVCKYIDLMVVFGRDFDTDSRLPWAGELLRQGRNPGVKTRLLLEAGKKHLRYARQKRSVRSSSST